MTDQEYPWNVLGIDETDDKKIIKKAYATLIKQYKPDEYPEKFQKIQEAYQYILYLNKTNKNISEEVIVDKVNSNTDETNFSQDPINKSRDEKIGDELAAELENILQQHQGYIDTISNWIIFKKFNKIYDLSLKKQLSLHVFATVAEFNIDNKNNNKKTYLSLEHIKYLDKIFSWSSYWQELETIFPIEYFNATLLIPEQIILPDDIQVPIFSRAFALYIDSLLINLLLYWSKYVSDNIFNSIYKTEFRVLYIIAFMIIYRILMEVLLPTHRSLGKMSISLYIINKKGNQCTFQESVIRHLVLISYTLPFLVNEFITPIDNLYLVLFSAIIVVLNIISITTKRKMIHDLLTHTYVLKIDSQ